ncbi:Dopey protein [Ancylostoma ceylanicum]|uniref:Dopey protein n=1 Tax=Ancylostoma ceylanicum TaxID=53326 RepID=A0A0D6LHE5_9BILA|nr:Dopey protein [Ancylostoma ceylanicum]
MWRSQLVQLEITSVWTKSIIEIESPESHSSEAGTTQTALMSSSSGGVVPGDVTAPNPLHNTSKYKVYVQAVDRALKTFENPNEWADLISALAKLAKVFQSNAKFGDIPKPVTVAKRLSQCLHPALPMGVHLKALETYRQIFDILGPQSLPKLLYLFAVGLFPLMDHCGIKVKSELFNIFEQYLLPLGQNLRPALPGFLAGVLLGLEEGTEFYDRSLSVLDRVCEGVGERAFFACLWQAVLGSPSVRLPAMLYVNAKFDKTRSLDDQIAIVGDHVNHMVAALCAVANDSGSPLVQRNLLDFLCAAFPLDSTNLTSDDFVQLLMRCMFVVLRRDMSLNRRLYTWLMNPSGGNVAISSIPIGDDGIESTFFTDNALPLIVEALTEYLKLDLVEIPQVSTNAWAYGWGDKKESEQHQFAEVRVCRLLLYLQDRADIGVPVLNKVFALFLVRVSNVYERLTHECPEVKENKNPDVTIDRSNMRLSLGLNKSSSTSRIGTVESAAEKEKDRDRRLDEITKTFNLLLNSLEPGFLFDFLGSWFTRLISVDDPCSESIAQFAKVVTFCLETCNLDGDRALRSQFLPKLLSLILNGLHNDKNLMVIESTALLQVIDVCSRLLEEISQSGAVEDHRGSSELPGWLQDVLKVVDAESWIQRLSHSSHMMDASDLSARTTVFDLALSVYLKCASVLSQHEAISGRMADGQSSVRCGHAIWLGLGLSWCAYEHERLSRLMALLHSRKPNEPSSDMENIIVSALTSNDTMISTEAAQTFHRMWMLTRTGDDQPPLCTKPFNRAVMLLLGVLADESVSRARTELKSAAAAWFIDCAKHNDLPRIVQMLATMLMNPVTARISIQYIFQEARLCRDQFSSLPNDVSVVTLVTSDGKQRLYHFDGPVSEGAWQYDLKNRLLLSSETGACEAEQAAVSTCATGAGDIPNFDEDTDSLDTLSISLDGVDGAVVETLQYMIDCVVEEEESELDNQRQLECALANAPPEGEPVIFANDDECETETTTASVVASKPRHSSGDRPAPLVGDSVARFKKGHRRQDSLQESIFSMTEKELKTFDATELLRPSVDSTSEGVSLFHELHVHMLLYGESGRVVDLGRAETAFRILTALLCPRGSHVSNRMLLSCLVSSGTAALNGDSTGTGSPLSGSLVDLMAKHVRAILGQHFWGTTGDEDATKHRHLTLLELLITVGVLNALKKRPEHHEMWFQFVIQILPWMERSLATVMVRVVEQLCKNIETAVAVCFPNNTTLDTDSAVISIKESEHNYPSCFITMTLETITTLLHFCVIDGSVAGSAIQTTTPLPVAPHSGGTSMVGQAGGVNLSKLEGSRGSFALRQACNDMLTSLPHALATICDLWSVIRSKKEPLLPLGSPQHLRQLVLDLLSPIAQHHQQAFLTALSLVWLTRSGTGATAHRKIDPDQPNFQYTPAQNDIANLLLSLKVISFEELVSAVTDTLKEVGVKATKLGAGEKATFPTEAPLLELVHGCVKAVPTTQLRSCWLPFQALFSDAPLANLPPRAVFLLYIILCDYVRCAGASYIVEDKTMSRAVQDAVQRLTEAVNAIVGWQLETTTWLKRTLVVKHDQGVRSQDASPSVEMNTPLNTPLPSMNQSEQNSMRGSTLSLMTRPSSLDTGTNAGSLPEKRSSSNLRSSVKDTNNNKRDPAHSTQALFLLAENLAELVDSVCKSDDKERLLPTLHAVWGNVVPYLRAKNARNSRFFLASSQLLASMSSFSYMRPVWKKTTLELLLDSSFFKMDMQSLKQWLIVTDHLMTHDKTSFKDLLKSIAYTPNASFSIMTSKEQEYEARAQAVKRLAFVVLGSELDQYQAQMNDIQERLSENLRVSQSPSIRSAVFLCIRVLLLRLRPPSLIGIWPIMVTELVHVLLQMEQQLCAEGNGIEDLGCHWAFVNSVSTSKTDLFLPFAGRINKLLRTKFGKLTPEELANLSPSLCGMKMLTTFEELRPFFYALATQNKALPGTHEGAGTDSSFLAGSLSYKNAVQRLEHALCVDFAEHWQL